jgi:hypothetical protein
VSDTTGASVLTALFQLDNVGRLDSGSAGGVVSNVVAFGFATAMSMCTQGFIVDQKINLNCDNSIKAAQVAQGRNCALCKQIVTHVEKLHAQLEKDASNLNPSFVPSTASDSAVQFVHGSAEISGNDGACQYVCMQCVARNVTQNVNVQISSNCDTSTQSFRTAFVSGMSTQARIEIAKHQNALGETGLKVDTVEQMDNVAVNLVNSLSQMTSTSLLSTLQQQALVIQSTKIDPGSTSVVIQNLDQSVSVSMIATLTSSMFNDNIVRQAINFDEKSQLIQLQTDFNDLVSGLGGTVRTLSDLLSSLTGKIVITLIGILTTVLLVVAAFYFVQARFLVGK